MISRDVLQHTSRLVPHLNDAALFVLKKRIAKALEQPSGIESALRHEAKDFERQYIQLGRMNQDELLKRILADPSVENVTLRTALLFPSDEHVQDHERILYDPAKTTAYSRRFWTTLIQKASLPPSQRNFPSPQDLTEGSRAIRDNPVGRILLSAEQTMATLLPLMLARIDSVQNYRRLLLIRLALEECLRAEKAYPRALSDLVPTYLDSLHQGGVIAKARLTSSGSFVGYSVEPCRIWLRTETVMGGAPTDIRCAER